MKIEKLNRILRFEQRRQDEVIQRLAAENMALDQLAKQLQQLDALQDSLLDNNNFDPRDLNSRQNRMSWSTMLFDKKTLLLDQQTRLKLGIEVIAEQLREQRSRVKAIEKLMSTTAVKFKMSQKNRELIELADIVNQEYTGIKP